LVLVQGGLHVSRTEDAEAMMGWTSHRGGGEKWADSKAF